MNLKLRQILLVSAMVAFLIISQLWVPFTWACVTSVITTAALCVTTIVVLRRKGLLELKTPNSLMGPALIPYWITGMSGIFYQQTATFGRAQNQPFWTNLAWDVVVGVQWVCLLFLVILAVALAYSFWAKRRILP